MRAWSPSPALLKLLVGQHILNGLSVAAGVVIVGVIDSVALGFTAGQPATLGAIAASISDQPATWRVKARAMAFGFSLALASTTAILLAGHSTPWALLVIGAAAFVGGMVTGLGRWAVALGMQALVAMVFVMGLPPLDFKGALAAEALFASGGVAYIAIALLLTRVTDHSARRMMASECFRELADYVRAIARFYDASIDLPETYGAAIRQQAALSEQLQMARALLLDRAMKSPERLRMAATIGLLLDVFDRLAASLSGLRALRAIPQAADLRRDVAIALRAGALDLQGLSLDLLTQAKPRLPPDHGAPTEALTAEAARLMEGGQLTSAEQAIVAATTRRIVAALAQIRRLETALSDDEAARAAIGGVDVKAFTPRRSYALRRLTRQLTLDSPVLRYATRLSLAMMSGGVAALSLGGENHGNWVLLTIAVILRPQYGLTRQRRDDRVTGTLIGCVLAAGAIAYFRAPALVALQAASLAVTHAFIRLNYRVASVGASLTALISLNLAAPEEAAPIVTRLADTLIGAAIAHLFSYVWPRWEFSEAPAHVARLGGQLALLAACLLDPSASEQDYRMTRKDTIEAIAALSDSAARMGGEPASTQRGLDEMTAVLIAAYVLTAQLSARRLELRAGPWKEGRDAAEEARTWIVKTLKGEEAGPPPEGEFRRVGRATLEVVAAIANYRRVFEAA